MAEATQVKGTERAAILLMTLGEQTAASVLKHMDIDEVQKLGVAMADIKAGEAIQDVVNNGQGVLAQLATAVGLGQPLAEVYGGQA